MPGAAPAGGVRAYVGLGANLGDPHGTIGRAIEAIAALPHTRLVARSSLYRSAPLDAAGPDYLNAVVGIDTRLAAEELLARLQALEQLAGRERPYRHAPRTLDLDLLLYGTGGIATPVLTVPHPRMAQRAFVLHPLAEIAPALVTPAQLAAVTSQVIVRLPSGPDD